MIASPNQPATSDSPPTSKLPPVVRGILGVLTGVVAGGIVVALIELPGMVIHPLPEGTDTTDQAALQAHAARAPLTALVGVAIAWAIGPLVGSFLAALIAGRAFFNHGMIVAGIFLMFVVMNLRAFPHPTWLGVTGVVAPLAMGWVGSSLAEWLASRLARGPRPYDMREKNMACK
jgi:hypothetical protein